MASSGLNSRNAVRDNFRKSTIPARPHSHYDTRHKMVDTRYQNRESLQGVGRIMDPYKMADVDYDKASRKEAQGEIDRTTTMNQSQQLNPHQTRNLFPCPDATPVSSQTIPNVPSDIRNSTDLDDDTIDRILISNDQTVGKDKTVSEKEEDGFVKAGCPVVFNKRLFSAQTLVTITEETRRIMKQNEERLNENQLIKDGRNNMKPNSDDDRPLDRKVSDIGKPPTVLRRHTHHRRKYSTLAVEHSGEATSTNSKRRATVPDYRATTIETNTKKSTEQFSKSNLIAMQSVVDGLKLIHKHKDHVKDCLSQVITLETYPPLVHIEKKPNETGFSCYYIVNGSVDVMYGRGHTKERNVYRPNIIYSHRSGEYIGLVSAEGLYDDLAPPLTIFTKEDCEFLRIDRQAFHDLMDTTNRRITEDKEMFIKSGVSVLSKMNRESRLKVLPHMLKQKYPANHTLLEQGVIGDHIYVVVKGRCVATRCVHVPETFRSVSFTLRSFQIGSFFGEECLLGDRPSHCTVTTSSAVHCYKLPRSALEVVNRDQLRAFIEANQNVYPNDDILKSRGYRKALWDKYKRSLVVCYLRASGNERLVAPEADGIVQLRTDQTANARENYERFLEKGSRMIAVQAKSPVVGTQRSHVRSRPKTAPAFVRSESQTSASSQHKPKPLQKQASFQSEDGTRSPSVRSDTTSMGSAKDRKHRNAWQEDDSSERHFMENGVLVTMESDDIVKKAKAAADTSSVKLIRQTSEPQLQQGESTIQSEHIRAKTMIAACKIRSVVLARKLWRLDMGRPEDKRKYKDDLDISLNRQSSSFKQLVSRRPRPVTALGLKTS